MKELRSKIIEDKEQPSIPMVIVGNKRVRQPLLPPEILGAYYMERFHPGLSLILTITWAISI